jgi:site-specific DNA-methyltransferase (adenine-specific)
MLSDVELSEMAKSMAEEGLISPCVLQGDVLLDGRNRIAACKLAGVEPRFIQYEGDSPVAFIVSANLSRRHLDKGQKIALAIEIEPHFAAEAKKRMLAGGRRDPVEKVTQGMDCPDCHCDKPSWILADEPPDAKHEYVQCEECGYVRRIMKKSHQKSRDQAAKTVGVSGKLVSAAKAIKAADPERFEKVKQGKLSVAKAKKEIKAEQDKRDLSAAQKTVGTAKRKSIESVCDLRVCSCRELFASGIKPDAVITDPPYPQEFLPVFTELAEGCKAVGVPLVAVMSGQSYLPEVMRRLCEHLRYRWTLAYMTPGGQAVQQWQAKVNTSWKPVILFGDAVEWFGDVAVSKTNDNEKRFHEWGQSLSGMADLVDRLTKPGQLVCDPFLGAGSAAVVSLKLGRRFVGCDVDADCVQQAREWVMQ